MLEILELIIMLFLSFVLGAIIGCWIAGVVIASKIYSGDLIVTQDPEDGTKYLSLEFSKEMDDALKRDFVMFRVTDRKAEDAE